MKQYKLWLIISCLITVVGCQKQETAVNNGTKPIYLEGYLQTGQYAILHIAPTYDISGKSPNYVDSGKPAYYVLQRTMDSTATVQYYKDINVHVFLYKEGLLVDSLSNMFDNGISYYEYTSPRTWWCLKGNRHIIEAGGDYKIEVKTANHAVMVAECVVPQKVEILKLDTVAMPIWNGFTYSDSLVYFVPIYTMKLSFIDPSNQQNYYKIETFGSNKKSYSNQPPYDTNWFKFFNSSGIECSIFDTDKLYDEQFFSDKLFNGNKETLLINNVNVSDSLFSFNFISISEGYYKRLKSCYLYHQNLGNNYAEPTPIYSNFSNAIGFLAGLTISSDTIRIKNYYLGNVYIYKK